MSREKKLCGMFLAASPDICAGLIIAHLWVRYLLPPSLPQWHMMGIYTLGVACALAPDVSLMVYNFLFRKKLDSYHRDLTHYPQWIVPPLLVAGLWTPWAWFVAACLTAHFADDLTDPRGLALLAPFSWKRFQVLAKETRALELEDWLNRYFFQPTYKSAMVGIAMLLTINVLLFV